MLLVFRVHNCPNSAANIRKELITCKKSAKKVVAEQQLLLKSDECRNMKIQ